MQENDSPSTTALTPLWLERHLQFVVIYLLACSRQQSNPAEKIWWAVMDRQTICRRSSCRSQRDYKLFRYLLLKRCDGDYVEQRLAGSRQLTRAGEGCRRRSFCR
jgi:hypothetical protein